MTATRVNLAFELHRQSFELPSCVARSFTVLSGGESVADVPLASLSY